MLGGVCTAWLVLVAPTATPLDPFHGAASRPHVEGTVPGDLVDPFAEPRAHAREAPARRSIGSLAARHPG